MDEDTSFTVGSESAEEILPWQTYWTAIELIVNNPVYPDYPENVENIVGDIQPQLSSWAGNYNANPPDGPSE